MKFTRANSALAIDPKASGIDYNFTSAAQEVPDIIGDTAIIHVRGPLSHHDEWWFESYDAIVRRAEIAYGCAEAKQVLWLGDTPGGDVSGLFATARMLLRMKEASGKRSAWYTDGMTCSAGVGLAMHCDEIYVPPEARFGSIGVIAEMHSYAKLARAHGEEFALVTSGAFKADGHPYADIDPKMLARVKESVDYEAALFFEWVAERTGVSVATVAGWEAKVFHGQQAIDVGLADAVTDDEGALELVSRAADNESEDDMPGLANKARAQAGASTANTATSAADSLDDARKRLGKIAGEDSDEGRKARKALDAMDAEGEDEDTEPKHDEPDGDEGSDDSDDDDASAADDSDDASAADDSDDASAADDSDDASAADDSDDASAADDSDDASAAEDSDDARKAKAKDSVATRALKAMREAQASADAAGRKARAVLRSGAKDSAAKARAHLATQDRCLAEARTQAAVAGQATEWADMYRSNAAVHARIARTAKASAKVVRPVTAAANALRGHRAKGTAMAPSVKPPDAHKIPASMMRAANLTRFASTAITDEGTEDEGLGLCTPEEAAKHHAALQTQILGLTNGRAR